MIKEKLDSDGCFLIKVPKQKDMRGFFSRGFCKSWFKNFEVQQTNWSYNRRLGTLRGFHYQTGDHREEKIITVVNGGVMLAILDLNSSAGNPSIQLVHLNSITDSIESEEEDNVVGVKIGKNVAVAFQTLCDDTLVNYLMSASFNSDSYRGLNALDPLLGIEWPLPVTVMSDRDRSLPRFFEFCG